MKGTFLKDLMNLRGQFVYYGLIAVVFFVVAALTGNIYYFAGLSIFCGVVAPVSALAYDEKDNWDKFALASGVTRRSLALSRYLLGLTLLVPVWALSFVLFALPSFRTSENLYTVLAYGGLGLAVVDIVLPLVFKIGVEKARTIYIVIVVAVMVLCVSAASFIELVAPSAAFAGTIAVAVLGVLGVPVSVCVSLAIYRNKDF